MKPKASAPRLLVLFILVGVGLAQHAEPPRGSAGTRPTRVTTSEEPAQVYLESMEDLEHVAYLSLRNFNITDQGLIAQSSWLTGLGGAPAHKQKAAESESGESQQRDRLALTLESFIAHLRNGHLRRMRLDELEVLAGGLNSSSSSGGRADGEQLAGSSEPNKPGTEQRDFHHRCNYLVSIYEHELRERGQQRLGGEQQQQVAVLQQSQGELEPSKQQVDLGLNSSSQQEQPSGPAERPVILDRRRMMQLCDLVVRCQSAEELVAVISGGWRASSSSELAGLKRNRRRYEAESQMSDYEQPELGRPKSLRDSLSLSIAKLCPLILFQLHEDEGLCTVRRDDRPPMVTVWAFATLFVTIVSFCSLIGLSITPLLGSTATEDSSDSSSCTSSPAAGRKLHHQWRPIKPGASAGGAHRRDHRTCLTLFEGLAVGSLVGSALFSLIPQAFELQERESNQGFLLKALIIFFGIYLFFCSERIMRIALDARQLRKKKKLLEHRSFNSFPLPSTTVDFVDHHHHHHHHHHHQQQQLALLHSYQSALMPTDSRQSTSEAKNNAGTGGHKAKGSGRALEQPCSHAVDPHTGAKAVNFPSDEHRKSKRQSIEPNTDGKVGAKRSTAASASDKQLKNRTRRRRTRHQLLANKRLSRPHHRSRVRNRLRNTADSDQDRPYLDQSDCRSAGSSLDSSSASHSLAKSQRKLSRLQRAGSLIEWPQDMVDYWSGNSNRDADDYDDESQDSDSLSNRRTMDLVREPDLSDCKQTQAVCRQIKQLKRQLSTPEQRASFYLDEQQVSSQPRYTLSAEPAEQPTMVAKQDISTVAWMIVLGDGLHNFIDGISIGAAFSESILSGVSISVAVICEEFPHELGDFAVLVSSGMTVRQALGYNFLSACTCYFGMAVGIILGDVNDGASYISALAAGVFLYIALVDMMGELSATLEDASRDSITKTLKLLLLQNVGIFIGISIIFILSFIDF